MEKREEVLQPIKEIEDIIDWIIPRLESYRDEQRLKLAAKSYPTAMKVIGVTTPNEKIVLKDLKTQTTAYSARRKIELAKALSQTGIFECQHIALEYLGRDKKTLLELNHADLNELCIYMDNWVSVDCFSIFILGYAWRTQLISTEQVKEYFSYENFWYRRMPIVATVALNQKAHGGKGDSERTLEICTLAVDDHVDLINKAMSWALRELSKVDRQAVQDFMDAHKHRLHSRVLREVGNKIITGKKN